MAAEGDGFSLLIAAIGVAAVLPFQFDEGEMPCFDPYTTQLDRLGVLEYWHGPGKRERPGFAGARHGAVPAGY